MEEITGIKSFYQVDMRFINYHKKNVSTSSFVCSNENIECFFICYVYEGKLDYFHDNNISELNEGEFVLCRPYEKFKIFCPPTKRVKFSVIQFEQSVISQVNPSLTLLRAFIDRESNENNVYKLSEMDNPELIKNLFNTINIYIKNNLNRINYLALLLLILSETSVCFNKNNETKIEKYTDEYDVKIYDYICRNSCTNVTIESIAEKYFVSKWYINKVCNKFYNLPFKDTVLDMRMWHARDVMRNSGVTLNKLYEMCGYKEYSGFYKAYKRNFGVSPKDDYNNYKKTGNFLTK